MPQRSSLIASIIRQDPLRWHVLAMVRALHLPDCWVAAGFIRNAVWDHLHQRSPSPPAGDVDVIWFDPARTDPTEDRKYEELLRLQEPSITWSVKNQARMHSRNHDAPYASAADAMRFWPETATAVAVRRLASDDCEVAAPLGLDDLFELILRPTARFCGEKRAVFEDRMASKGWLENWPSLRLVHG